MSLKLSDIIKILKKFAWENKKPLKVILIGGLALHYYGKKERKTGDIDAEVKGEVESLVQMLKKRSIPSDIGEDISGWSVVSMPPGYRRRVINIYRDALLSVNVLNPVDFIVAKLRRFTDEDMEDALFVADKFKVTSLAIRKAADAAISNSPKDTALFIFRKNLELFMKKLATLP